MSLMCSAVLGYVTDDARTTNQKPDNLKFADVIGNFRIMPEIPTDYLRTCACSAKTVLPSVRSDSPYNFPAVSIAK